MNILPHIKILPVDNKFLIVEVEDTELFDFIDDHLTEKHGIYYDAHTSRTNNDGLVIHKIYFSSDITKERIANALCDISSEEIERIFRINN